MNMTKGFWIVLNITGLHIMFGWLDWVFLYLLLSLCPPLFLPVYNNLPAHLAQQLAALPPLKLLNQGRNRPSAATATAPAFGPVLEPVMGYLLGDAPRPPMFPPIFLRHLCIFLLIVASPRRSALAALILESDDHVT